MLVRQGEQCLSGKNSTCIIVSIKVGLKNETCLFFFFFNHGHQGHLSLGLCRSVWADDGWSRKSAKT